MPAVLCRAVQQNEFVRPGFELGFKDGDRYYIRNHLQFNILVHPTHGEYMRARQGYKDAAVLDNVNARKLLVSRQQLLEAGASEEQLSSMAAAGGRELQADAAGGCVNVDCRRAAGAAVGICIRHGACLCKGTSLARRSSCVSVWRITVVTRSCLVSHPSTCLSHTHALHSLHSPAPLPLLCCAVFAGAGPAVEMFMIVGFEVSPCSIKRTPGKPVEHLICDSGDRLPPAQEVKEGEKIMYTYDVYWERNEKIKWASRWDSYLRMPGGKVHWFSILNSLLIVLVMASLVAMILIRTIRWGGGGDGQDRGHGGGVGSQLRQG